MWRAFFLAVGIYLCILGAQCMVVDNFVLASSASAAPPADQQSFFGGGVPAAAPARVWTPPEWAPWSMLSTGAVVILYSLTLAKPAG